MDISKQEKQEIQNYCDQYKGCKGCPFAGGACVAPVGDHKFREWVREMLGMIRGVRDK